MAEPIDDSLRHLVPRWRPFQVSAELGEVAAIGAPKPSGALEAHDEEIADLERNWKANRSLQTATDLIDAAIVLGPTNAALEAADWLLGQGNQAPISQRLASMVLGSESPSPTLSPPAIMADQRHRRIARYRRQLAMSPRDALLWVDLAREYSILGQNRASERAVRIALGLAPANRFVIRSACRFYLHVGENARAHHVVSTAPGLMRDPWLLAAEIVSARMSARSSRLLKHGRDLLASSKYSPRQLSELAGVLGTEEHWSGSSKAARRHLQQALIDPTENAVAQAAWLSRRRVGIVVPPPVFEVPLAFEALTWKAMERRDQHLAVAHAESWQRDEPFSGRPAILGSWTASVALGNHQLAIDFVESGRPANPSDPRLLANYFYALACSDRLSEATEVLAHLELNASGGGWTEREWAILLEADRGLLAFRRGDSTRGTEHYQRAIAIATYERLIELGAHAYLNYAMEVVRTDPNSDISDADIDSAVKLSGPSSEGALASFAMRIKAIRNLRLRTR